MAVVPPLIPSQLQLQGPAPVGVADSVPLEQRFAVGAMENDWPLSAPQAPFIGHALVVKVASRPFVVPALFCPVTRK